MPSKSYIVIDSISGFTSDKQLRAAFMAVTVVTVLLSMMITHFEIDLTVVGLVSKFDLSCYFAKWEM